MKFSGRTDIQAPAEQAFEAIADFSYWERAAMRRGAEVVRRDKLAQPGPGMTWMARFAWRGRDRQMLLTLRRMDRPTHLVLEGEGPSVDLLAEMELIALSATRSRLVLQLTVKPHTLAARVYLETLRLTRRKVNARFATRLQAFATLIEQRQDDEDRT